MSRTVVLVCGIFAYAAFLASFSYLNSRSFAPCDRTCHVPADLRWQPRTSHLLKRKDACLTSA
jgi:hypothetical protein